MVGLRSKGFACLALTLLLAACGDRPSRSADQPNAHCAPGDTVWKRRMEFDPVRLTRPMVDAAIDDWRSVVDESRRPSREAVENALHLPKYLPAVKTFQLTSSGHVWIQSYERRDTLSVWYSLERGDDESPPRPVLLPEGSQLKDATETHVWGVWKDELDINYVVGRRLVSASR